MKRPDLRDLEEVLFKRLGGIIDGGLVKSSRRPLCGPLRPDFEDDRKVIKAVDEIVLGRRYQRVRIREDGSRHDVRQLGIVIDEISADGKRVKGYSQTASGKKLQEEFYLADVGVIAYGNGSWNLWNYLVEVEE